MINGSANAYTAALACRQAGISVLPTRADKRPDAAVLLKINGSKGWKSLESALATEEQISDWFNNGGYGYGIIGGAISGNVEQLDFDRPEGYPHDTPERTLAAFTAKVEVIQPGLMAHLSVSKTPKGYHVRYRCDSPVDGNIKLAEVPKVDESGGIAVDAHGRVKVATLIETRGEGGYAIGPGSPGYAHLSGPNVWKLVTLTAEEREILLSVARSFDQLGTSGNLTKYNVNADETPNSGKPGDDFNQRGDWEPILQELGLKFVHKDKSGCKFYQRIGSEHPVAANLGYGGKDFLRVFSSNLPIPSETTYSKFAAYTALHHNGDFSAAASDLRKQGYGSHLEHGNTSVNEKSTFDTFGTDRKQENSKNCSPTEWPEPESLPDNLPDVEPFDYSLIPDAFQKRVYDIANRMSCPPDFSAIAMIVAAAAVIGRKITIRPKRYDDWSVVPNLWGCVVGRPGLMKTSAIQQALHPLRALAHEASQEHARRAKDAQSAKELAVLKAKKLRKEVQGKLDDGESSDESIKKLLTEARDAENADTMPPLKRYIVMDATYESVSDMLTESPNGFLQYRDELAGWWASLSRDGQENARSFWLECWNGDGDYYIDRIMRGRMYVPSNTVSVLGATQPGKLRSYLEGAIRGDASDDGMIQRHQMLVWPDTTSEWKKVDAWPDNQAKREVLDVFRRLDKIDPFAIGAKQEDGDDFLYLRFTPEAQELFDEWYGHLELQLRSDRDPPHLESHFSKYRSLIPSLALIFHLIDVGHGQLGAGAISRAIRWDQYLASHARRAYGGTHWAAMESAKRLLRRITEGELQEGFSIRDVYVSHQNGLATKEQVQEAIDVLIDFGWCRTEKITNGGRPSVICHLNPKMSDFLRQASTRSIKSPPAVPFGTFDADPERGNREFAINLNSSGPGGRGIAAPEFDERCFHDQTSDRVGTSGHSGQDEASGNPRG